MRRTFGWRDAGPIYTERWIPPAQPLTFSFRDSGSTRRPNLLPQGAGAPGHCRPRVINVDGNPSYPSVIEQLKRDHVLGQRCRCRVVPYLNNIVEQDHRAIKRRVNASLGFRSFDGAERTIQGYEAMHMIRRFDGWPRAMSLNRSASSRSSSASLAELSHRSHT